VFGTRYVIQSGFYGLLSNVEVICPRVDEVETIHGTYTELLRDRLGSEAQHQQLTALAYTLIARDKLDAILIAGTDLSLIFNESNTGFPHIDCAAVHIQAIMEALLNDPSPR
jgi:aspartate racemase